MLRPPHEYSTTRRHREHCPAKRIGKHPISPECDGAYRQAMGWPTSHASCFLAEWYRPELTEEPVEPTIATLDDAAAKVSADGTPVRLVAMLAVPSDAVLFGVFMAASAATVAQTCDHAGMTAQRLTRAEEVHFRAI
jgi:hypothetical protein